MPRLGKRDSHSPWRLTASWFSRIGTTCSRSFGTYETPWTREPTVSPGPRCASTLGRDSWPATRSGNGRRPRRRQGLADEDHHLVTVPSRPRTADPAHRNCARPPWKFRTPSARALRRGTRIGMKDDSILQLRATLRLIRRVRRLGQVRALPGLHYQAGTALHGDGTIPALPSGNCAPHSATATRPACWPARRSWSLVCTEMISTERRRCSTRRTSTSPGLGAPDPCVHPGARPEPLKISRALERSSSSRTARAATTTWARSSAAARADRVAKPRLRRFIKHCEGNPREWGVTMRWEIAKAKELLARSGRSRT